MNGHLHWNLLAQWEELKTGLRRAAGGTPRTRQPPREIHGIGVDTWGVDFGLVGRDGDVLGNPFHYRDRRTDGVMERTFAARQPREQIFDATGIQFMQFNTLFQLLAMHEAEQPAAGLRRDAAVHAGPVQLPVHRPCARRSSPSPPPAR